MAKLVCMGAQLQCNCGLAPSVLAVLPANMVNTNKLSAATEMDNKPMVNIPPFGVCTSNSNPAVVAAKAAGSPGAPCVPVTVTPWSGASAKVKIGGMAVLMQSSKLKCMYNGDITITAPGQGTVDAAG